MIFISLCLHPLGLPIREHHITPSLLHVPSSSSPPSRLCLSPHYWPASLPARLLPVSATGSITTTLGSNAHSAPLCSAWTRREAAGLRSHPRWHCALSLTVIRCLLPAHLTSSPPSPARVDGCGCGFDGAKQARLIEGLRPGGIYGAPDSDGEKREGTGEKAICPLARL